MSSWLKIVRHNETSLEYPPLLIASPSLALLALFIFSPPGRLRLLLLAILICTALFPPLLFTAGGNPAADFGIASSNFQRCLIALDRFILTSAEQLETTFVRPSQRRAPAPGLSLQRVLWSIENTLLMRGAGMKWQVKGVPAGGRHLGRTKFVWTRLLRALLVYLTLDIVSTYMQRDPYFRRQQSFAQVEHQRRLVILTCAGLAGGLALELLYDLTCALGVLLGIWTPSESPNLFGQINGAYTVRRFWSRFWHQCFRRVFVTPATALVKGLGFKSGSASASLVALFVPFALSAAQHAYAIRVMGGPGYGVKTSAFFLLQPVGILAESAVQSIFAQQRASPSIRSRSIGYVWVLFWMLSCGHLFFDELVQAGMWEVNPAPLSVYKGLTRGQWWAP